MGANGGLLMQVILTHEKKELSELREAFAHFRRAEGAKRSYSEPLRRMAADAARERRSLTDVAIACGVSKQSVHTWCQIYRPRARRLSVAPEEKNENSGAGKCGFGDDLEASNFADTEAPVRSVNPSLVLSPFRFHLNSGVSLEASPEQALWLVRQLGGRE